MCQTLKAKIIFGGGVVLLLTVGVVILWAIFKPGPQVNNGSNQIIQNKNQLLGIEANLGGGNNCDRTGLIIAVVCLTVLLLIVKCGAIGYCGSKMLRARRERKEERMKRDVRFRALENEIEGLTKQKKRDDDKRMGDRMKNNASSE